MRAVLGTHWLFIPPPKKKIFIVSSLVLFNAANKSQRGLALSLLCSQLRQWDVGNLGTGIEAHPQVWDTSHSLHGGQSTSAPSAGMNWELWGYPALAPRHTHTFPTALPPGTTSHRPGATCQGHPTCAGSTWGDPGPPAPPEGPGLCGEGAADPSGIKDLGPTSHQGTSSTHKWDWEGKCSPHSLLGVIPGFGGSFGAPVQLQCGALPVPSHCWLRKGQGQPVPFPLFIATAAAEMTKTRESWSRAA